MKLKMSMEIFNTLKLVWMVITVLVTKFTFVRVVLALGQVSLDTNDTSFLCCT